MIVQSIINPNSSCQELEMYYRVKNKVTFSDTRVFLEQNSELSTDTYMNCFDAATWNKYTGITRWKLCVFICGKGTICLYKKNRNTSLLINKIECDSNSSGKVEIPFSSEYDQEIYYLDIVAATKMVVDYMYFETEENRYYRDVHIGAVICTYKRNKELNHTINVLKSSNFFQQSNQLFGKMSIRIIDNASELPKVNEHLFSLFHNENTGGSGGFSRGIIETRKVENEFGITNIVLMDDDIEVIPETLYRLYALLVLEKDEYQNEVVAGRMFRKEQRYIQYTAAEIWNKGDLKHVGQNNDMRKKECLLTLNDNGDAEYSGWWFACFPMEYVRNNLPLPFFLHCDDVEYGLRHGGRPIILNGIQVWHESFENRYSPAIAYYDTRNPLIVNSILYNDYSMQEAYNWWISRVNEKHSQKEFEAEYMIILGMLDYLKGVKYFLNYDMYRNNVRIKKKRNIKKIYNSILWRITRVIFLKKYLKVANSFYIEGNKQVKGE